MQSLYKSICHVPFRHGQPLLSTTFHPLWTVAAFLPLPSLSPAFPPSIYSSLSGRWLAPCPQYALWVSRFPSPPSSLYGQEISALSFWFRVLIFFYTIFLKTFLLLTYSVHRIPSILLWRHISVAFNFLLIYGKKIVQNSHKRMDIT